MIIQSISSSRQNAVLTIVDIVWSRAFETPERTAFTFLSDGGGEQKAITYGELNAAASECAARLLERGGEGERVLLAFQPGLEFIVAFLGCLYARAVAVPLYAPANRKGIPRIQAVAADAQARFALTSAAGIDRLQKWTEEVSELEHLEWLVVDLEQPSDGTMFDRCSIALKNVAFLQYTSGSTGAPKGVVVSHENLVDNEQRITKAMSLRPGTVAVSWLPMFHDMGLIGAVLGSIYSGCHSLLMSPASFIKRPAFWLESISRYRGEISGGPNFAYELCARRLTEEQMAGLDLSSWRVAYNGAEPVRLETLQRFAERFAACGFQRKALFPCYGMAEATLYVSGCTELSGPVSTWVNREKLERNEVCQQKEDAEGGQPIVSCGVVSADQVLIVHPRNSRPLDAMRVGEIWLRSPSVAQGYWNNVEANGETFRASLATAPDQREFLRTGDLGFISEGRLFVTGRTKDVIIVNGRNIYPQDVEHVVEASHPSLQRGGCAAFRIQEDGSEGVAVVQELARRQRPDFGEVVGAIRQAVVGAFSVSLSSITLIKTGNVAEDIERKGSA